MGGFLWTPLARGTARTGTRLLDFKRRQPALGGVARAVLFQPADELI